MKILITGGTGFVGSFLTTRLILDGHKVSVLSRNAKAGKALRSDIDLIPGDPAVKGAWQRIIKGSSLSILLCSNIE